MDVDERGDSRASNGRSGIHEDEEDDGSIIQGEDGEQTNLGSEEGEGIDEELVKSCRKTLK
jgi:hypothetical protein